MDAPHRRPPYRSAAPGDTLGLKHLREALRDVEFPQHTSSLRARVGNWRMPIDGAHFETLGAWLEGVPEKTFRSADDVAESVARAHPELRE
jgi:hypothetical protein